MLTLQGGFFIRSRLRKPYCLEPRSAVGQSWGCCRTFGHKSCLVCTRGGYSEVVGARRAEREKDDANLAQTTQDGANAQACAIQPFRPDTPCHWAGGFLRGPHSWFLADFGGILFLTLTAPPTQGPGRGPKVTLRGPKVTLHFLAAHGHSGHIFPTLASKSSLVCTPVAYFDMVGARRAALCGPCVGKPDLRLIRPQILIEGMHTGPER